MKMKKKFFVHDESTLSASEFHNKFKGSNDDLIQLDLFESSDEEETNQDKNASSAGKPAYRPIVKVNDIIKLPPKSHLELVNCFRERLHLQSHLKYISVEEQKELAEVLIMAIIALWPQHRKQAAHPFLGDTGNKELQRRVAVFVIETVEKLFYEYVDKAEDWNSKNLFSSQANLSRLKTQILHEADRSLNVLVIRRKIAEKMHDEGGWLNHPSKGYITTLLKVLDKWNNVTDECQSHNEFVRRQIRELKTMMPVVSEEMQDQLKSLVEHYNEVARHRQELEQETNDKGTSSKESLSRSISTTSCQESFNEKINKVKESMEDFDDQLNPRVIFKRSNSMPKLHDDIALHEGFENLKVGSLQVKRLSIDQLVMNSATRETQKNTEAPTPREDLQHLVAKKQQVEEIVGNSEGDFSPLLQAQKQVSPRRKKRQLYNSEKLRENEAKKIMENTQAEETTVGKTEQSYQPPSLNIKVPGKNIVRICDGRISNRTNTSVLTLDMHPTIYNEFLNEVDMETVNTLDLHLYAGAEIQEVYNEITKTSTKDFLAFDKDDSVEKCPQKCRNISQVFMSGLLQDPVYVRYINPNLKSYDRAPWNDFDNQNEWLNEPKFAGIGREDMLKINNKSDLRRSTFLNATELGGAGQLAKNYASWLTWYRNNVDLDDFRKFISNHETDYLCQMHHLYDTDVNEEVLAEAARTSANLKLIREREDIKKRLLKEKSEYRKGFWNTQCINLGGLGREPNVILDQEESRESWNQDNEKKSSFLFLQNRLEEIWKSLKMPDTQRVNMAIKHSADPSLDKLSYVVENWASVTALVVERENLMSKLETFERYASDPNRFFEKGSKGSSTVRMNESKVREKLIKGMKRLEMELLPLLHDIKKLFNDEVTYQGRNYISKMKSDRTEMLYWLQQERRSERLDAMMMTNRTTTTTTTTHLAPVFNKIDVTVPVDVTIT